MNLTDDDLDSRFSKAFSDKDDGGRRALIELRELAWSREGKPDELELVRAELSNARGRIGGLLATIEHSTALVENMNTSGPLMTEVKRMFLESAKRHLSEGESK